MNPGCDNPCILFSTHSIQRIRGIKIKNMPEFVKRSFAFYNNKIFNWYMCILRYFRKNMITKLMKMTVIPDARLHLITLTEVAG